MATKNKKLIAWTIAIILFLVPIYIFNLLNFINAGVGYAGDGGIIHSPWFSDGITYGTDVTKTALGITSITLGWLGSTFGSLCLILLIFDFGEFYPIAVISQVFTITDSLITGMFFTAISYMVMMLLITVAVKFKSLEIKKLYLAIFTVSWIIVGVIFYLIVNSLLGIESFTLLNGIDIVASSLAISGWWMITKKDKDGYILFIINDALYIIGFALIGLFVVGAGFMLYVIINSYCLFRIIKNKKEHA